MLVFLMPAEVRRSFMLQRLAPRRKLIGAPASSAEAGARCCEFLRLALANFFPVGAGLLAAALDQLLEALEVAAHLRLHDAQEVTGEVLGGGLALDVHLDVDPRLIVAERLERDDSVVLDLAVDRLPGDLLVRLLVGDLGRPLALLAPDLGDPLHVPVVELLNGLDSVHELRELLELRPLVVRLLDRDADLDRIVDLGHVDPSSEIGWYRCSLHGGEG
jgi:hypothetical protein